MFKYELKKTPKRSLLNGGQGWIRTTVHSREQIYSLSPLATRPPTHIKLSLKMPLTRFELVASPLPRECATPAPQRLISEPPSSLLLRVLPLTNLTFSQLLFGRVPAPQRQMPQGL